MTSSRPGSLRTIVVCLLCSLPLFAQQAGQQPPAPQPPQQQQPTEQQPPPQPPPAKPQPPQQKKNNPFDAIPQSTEPAPAPPQPQAPKLEGPKPTVEAPKPAAPAEDVIDSIQFRGARRVPQDTLRALIITKKGDKYDEEQLHRDFMVLWNTGRFDDLRMEKEAGPAGWIITFTVTERRVIRSIKYDGMKSITVSEILDRFKERKVGLSTESQYDPNKVQRGKVVLQEYLAERGRQFATVEPEIHQVPPASLEVVYKVDEGPKVKVGEITFDGNEHFSPLLLIRAMKNLHPYGIPYSVFLENLFAKTYDSTKLEEDQQRLQQLYQDNGYFTAHTTGAKVDIVDVGSGKVRFPLIRTNASGTRKNANIHFSIDE